MNTRVEVAVPATQNTGTQKQAKAIIGRRLTRNKVLEYYIEHPLLKGVTPDMLQWWFKHLSEPVNYKGQWVPKFQLQHPDEHIGISLLQTGYNGGGFTKGAILHIREFRKERYFEELVYCLKNDHKGISLQFYKGHLPSGYLTHHYTETSEGTIVNTTFKIGKDFPIIGHLFNPYLHRKHVDEKLIHYWQHHIVEEFQHLQEVIPTIYPAE